MISKALFYLLIFILPINLGKHYELFESYVWGQLVDYLVPTIYFQDILILVLLVVWVFESRKNILEKLRKVFLKKEVQVFFLFLFSVFLSVINSKIFIPSLVSFLRLFLYFGLFVYIVCEINLERDFKTILNILSIPVIFISILGVLQFARQGAVFNNYLFFGEQPYSASTYLVNKENVLGIKKVASYGLFRHPNTFGGFLSIILVWIYFFKSNNKFFKLTIFFGILGLLSTLSYTSMLSFILGIIFLRLPKSLVKKFIVLIFAFSFTLPLFKLQLPSFYRRSDLLKGSYRVIKEYPLFGVGFNNFTVVIDKHMNLSHDLRFTQPVHNVFVLLFAESGVFAGLLFIVLYYLFIQRASKNGIFNLFLVTLAQLVFLSSFDHYFLTMHQTLLLQIIVFGLVL